MSTFNAADFIDFRLNFSNKDPNFRLLGEQPTFLSERNVDLSSTIRLDKLLPNQFGLVAAADDHAVVGRQRSSLSVADRYFRARNPGTSQAEERSDDV